MVVIDDLYILHYAVYLVLQPISGFSYKFYEHNAIDFLSICDFVLLVLCFAFLSSTHPFSVLCGAVQSFELCEYCFGIGFC